MTLADSQTTMLYAQTHEYRMTLSVSAQCIPRLYRVYKSRLPVCEFFPISVYKLGCMVSWHSTSNKYMAGSSSGKYTNIKLDCYLKKALPLKDYLEVKTYEPCVIKAKLNKYHHRYVFLTHNALYVTTNPAKTILYAIHLKDVVNIDIIHDSAKFLQKDLQNSVQHLVVTYIKQDDIVQSPATEILQSQPQINNSPDLVKLERETISPAARENRKLFCLYSDIDDTAQFPIEEQNTASSAELSTSYTSSGMASQTKIVSQKKASSVSLEVSDISSSTSNLLHFNETDKLKLSNALHNDVNRASLFQTHFYILNENSTILSYLKAAWKSHILNSTMKLEMKYNQSGRSLPSETAKMLFLQLKRDLLQCESNEDFYVHFHELFTGISRSILIKKLFWKDNSVLLLAVRQLRKCHVVQHRVWDDDAGDRIELSTIIFTTLCAAMRGVEAVIDCYKEMAKIRDSYLPDLVSLIVTDVSSSKNSDLSEIIDERNLAACELLFEILKISNQKIHRKGIPKTFLTTSDMFEILSKVQVDVFLRNVVSSCVKMCNNASEVLLPSEAVCLFRCISTFHQITLKQYPVYLFAVNYLQEEFRYYLSSSTLQSRLPMTYPIRNILLQLLKITSNSILQATSPNK